jgi:collagen type III alpha
VSYAVFAVAVLLVLFKLGGIVGVNPLFLRMVPATTVANAAEPLVIDKAPYGELLILPEAGGPEAGGSTTDAIGQLLAISSKAADPRTREGGAQAEGLFQDEAPVFYRPSFGEMQSSGDGPVCGDLGDFPKSSRAVFPLPGDYFDSYDDSWGAARPQGGHEGSDLMSPTGTPEFAITDGTIVPVMRSNENGWNRLGGYTVMLQAAYDAGPIKKGDLFYYAHMDQKSSLPIGTKVRAGQQIGQVGDTGEGHEAARGKFPPHLHLGWYDAGSADGSRTNLQSGAMNPYPLLLWLEQNGGAVTGGTDISYCEAPQEPLPDSPRTSADLDTGYQDDARPSPIVGESSHDHSLEQEPAREDVPDENDEPVEAETAGAADKTPEVEPGVDLVDEPEDDGVEGRSTESPVPDQPESAPLSQEAPLPSDESGSTDTNIQGQVRFQPPAPSQSEPDSLPSYASILANAFGEVPGNAGQDGDKTGEKKRKNKKKKNLEPPARGESGDERPDEKRPVDPGKPVEPGGESSPRLGPANANDGPQCAAPRGGPSKKHGAYVTRAQRPQDGKQTPIGYDDWLKVVEADPDLWMRTAAETKTASGKMLRYKNKGMAVWTAHSKCKKVWFDLRGGNVVVEDPDEATIEKMQAIASALSAKVRGADGKED